MKLIRIYLILPALFSLLSCSKDDPEIRPGHSAREVRLLLPSNGLGDTAFSDDIMRGVLQAQKDMGFTFHYHVPTDLDDAKDKIREWEENPMAEQSLTIFGSNEYEGMAASVTKGDNSHSYLLIEASTSDFDIPVSRFSGYGVSFLTGVAAYAYTRADTAAYIGGQSLHSYIEECYIGFRDGFLFAGGQVVVAAYLSDKPDGFSKPHEAGLLADSLYRNYSFIYPVAGGSNSGVYSWLRSNRQQEKYAAGVDVDQSIYSDHIIGSMIKEIGRSLEDYLRLWTEGEELPLWTLFDLESGYTFFKVSEGYNKELGELIRTHQSIASEKEKEYNEGRY